MSTFPNSTRPSPLRSGPTSAESPPPYTGFDPPPEVAQAVINDLIDPFKSFHAVATDRGTTIEGLTLWMQRPDIARRLDAFESACTRRSRLQASSYLTFCIDALARAITGFSRDDAQTAPLPSSPKLDEQRRKSRETLLRMTRVMMQLSKFQQVPVKRAEKLKSDKFARPASPNRPADARTPNSPSRVASASQSVDHLPSHRDQPHVIPTTGTDPSRAQQSAHRAFSPA